MVLRWMATSSQNSPRERMPLKPPSGRRLTARELGRQQLVEVLRQHPLPGGPVVLPLLAPDVDPVRHALAAEDIAGVPRRVHVLPGPLTAGDDREPGAQHIELLALQTGEEVQRRGEEQVLRELVVEELLEPVRAAHARGSAE